MFEWSKFERHLRSRIKLWLPLFKKTYHERSPEVRWLFLTGIMPLIRSAKPSQSLPKLGTLFRQTSGRPLTKVRLTVHSYPDKFFTENEAFRKRRHLILNSLKPFLRACLEIQSSVAACGKYCVFTVKGSHLSVSSMDAKNCQRTNLYLLNSIQPW